MLHGQPPPRRILADNLAILGFSPSNHNNPHYSGVNLTEDAFAGANNTKAFELISWFLFNKLDSHKARKLFAHCWPIADYRSQPREYRSVAFKWLEELKKENKLLGDTVLRRSYLEDCRGERSHREYHDVPLNTYIEDGDGKKSKRVVWGLQQISQMQVHSMFGHHILAAIFCINIPKAETIRLNKINADTENRRDTAKRDWEDREQQIREQLQRLDKYQKQMQEEQRGETTTSTLLRHLMSDNIPMNQLEKYYLKRLDSLDSLWRESLDVLMLPSFNGETAYSEMQEHDFQLDKLSEMWLQAGQALNSVKQEALEDRSFDSRNKVLKWAKQQAAHYSRRALKAQALKNRLCRSKSCQALDNGDEGSSVIGAKRSYEGTESSLSPTALQMPSLKRARSTANRIQDIRDLVGKCVEEKLQESEIREIHAGRTKKHVQKSQISLELPKLSKDLMYEYAEMETDIISPVSKVTKPEVMYDRNGRRIRRVPEDHAPVSPPKVPSLRHQSKKSNQTKSTLSSTPKLDRLFKENRGGKVDAAQLNKSDNKSTGLTPMEIAHEKILEQMNNPPSSMITPPRSHTRSSTAHYNSSNFESPSAKDFSMYKRKLSEAADMEGVHHNLSLSRASLQQDHFLHNAEDEEDEDEEDIFQDLVLNVPQSTPQRPITRNIRGDLEHTLLSAASPANTSLVAYNAVIDEASVCLFGENMPDNFDDGGDMTM
ncbi:hypothetical protein NQZ79_g6331 [Umbelopsis isabellina]|nr:hypothetical protein NQZ79_g6331 [Umbelopsis isabellina]